MKEFNDKAESKKEKGGHSEPSKIENKTKIQKETPRLSDQELTQRLENYSNVGGKMEDYFAQQSILKKYLQDRDQTNDKRIISEIHYASGIRKGLPHSPIEDIRRSQEITDQKVRNDVLKEAKEIYRDSNSASKGFNRSSGMDHER